MKRVAARYRIALGLVTLLVSVLLLAVAIGFVPNPRAAIVEGRAKLCESIAVSSSVLVSRGDTAGLGVNLQGIAGRNRDILSAAVRSADGKLVAATGDHDKGWQTSDKSAAADSHVYVPIWMKGQKWGTVEVRFKPLGRAGVLGFLLQPTALLVTFVASASFLLFLVYLRKMLQHLDPSKVVPGRVRSALDTLAEGLMVLDQAERIVLANQALASITGRPTDDLMGCRAAQLPWATEDGASEFPWTRARREGKPQLNSLLGLRAGDGRLRTFVANCSPVLGQEGDYRGVLVSFDDVTELEAQKVELRKSKELAEAANRTKSDFLARISHEIRTPMNGILGFADVLRRGLEHDEAERRDYVETIHASGKHLLELINDLLDLSKIEAGRLEIEKTRCSPHQIISEVVAVLRVRACEKDIYLDYDWDGTLPETITMDPTRLRQALTNLVGNAIKFTETGGVRVVARLDGPRRKLAVDVTDTGIGIGEDALDRLFQPFTQADTSITRRFGGTGLGLAISRQLAEAMGGGIMVRSSPGQGSTFTLTVDTGPLDGVQMLATQPLESTTVGVTHGTVRRLPPIRVLCVEDGVSNQKLISLVLQLAGVATVDAAPNGQVAVEMAAQNSYDLILMDMQMPIMDGYTATAAIRSTGSQVPIIAMTAHAMKGEEEKCRAAGCTGYVPKPLDIDQLLSVAAGSQGDSHRPRPPGTPSDDRAIAAHHGAAPIRSALPTDDPEFCEIVVEFVGRMHEQVRALQTAWEDGELGRVAAVAHWLKGSGGTAGFNDFTAPARRLEDSAKESRLEDVQRALQEVCDLAARVISPAQTQSAQSDTSGTAAVIRS